MYIESSKTPVFLLIMTFHIELWGSCPKLESIHVLKVRYSTIITFHCLPYISPIATNIGDGNGTPLQYSCLGSSMDGGAWWAAVHGVAKSRTRLSDWTELNWMVPSSWVGSREEGKTDGAMNTGPEISPVTTTHVCLSFILPPKKLKIRHFRHFSEINVLYVLFI